MKRRKDQESYPDSGRYRRSHSYSTTDDLQEYKDSFRDRAQYNPDAFERDSRAGRPFRQDFSGRGPKGYRRSDERINDELNERLTQDHNVDASDIDVNVENGEVTLSGLVSDRRTKRIAGYIADEISGVIDVHNMIKIRKNVDSARSLT